MAKELFKTSYLGSTVKVFPGYLEWSMLLSRKSVPLAQVASIELGIPLYAQVTIETAGGKKIKIPVAPGEKTKLRDAIYAAMK